MRVLITGGRGQLGRALQNALAQHEVVATDLPEMDVTNAKIVQRYFDDLRPEMIIHAAAWTDTAGCEADPDQALLVNGGGARVIAEACARAGAAMLYVSTNEVFDGRTAQPYREEDEPNPLNAYGRSKLEGERGVQSLLDRCYVVRTSWLYGPGRVSFPEKIVQAAARAGTLKGVTDEVASPTLTADLAAGIAILAERAPYGVYHLSNSGYCSRLEWAKEVLRVTALTKVGVEPATQEEFEAPYRKPVFSALSLEKAARQGIQMRPWQEALQEYLQLSRREPAVDSAAPQVNR